MKLRPDLIIAIILCLGLSPAAFGQKAQKASNPGPKASAPPVELSETVLKWIAENKKSDEIDMIVHKEFTLTWQRVNITGTVKGTDRVMVAPKPGLAFKDRKNLLIHKMEYIEPGKKSFEFFVLLPEDEVYQHDDRLKITGAYIESNRSYGVRYGVRPVLIGGKVEQLPPD